MTRKDLDELEQLALKHYNNRVSLGNFDANAETITFLCGALVTLIRHLKKKSKTVKKA